MTFDTSTTERVLNSTPKELANQESARRRQDLQDVIDLIMHSPLKKGEIIRLSAENPIPLSSLKGENVEAQTAMALSMMSGAIGGDVKKADWVCKYGGYEPVKETKLQIDSVTFVDDIPRTLGAVAASMALDDEKDDGGNPEQS